MAYIKCDTCNALKKAVYVVNMTEMQTERSTRGFSAEAELLMLSVVQMLVSGSGQTYGTYVMSVLTTFVVALTILHLHYSSLVTSTTHAKQRHTDIHSALCELFTVPKLRLYLETELNFIVDILGRNVLLAIDKYRVLLPRSLLGLNTSRNTNYRFISVCLSVRLSACLSACEQNTKIVVNFREFFSWIGSWIQKHLNQLIK